MQQVKVHNQYQIDQVWLFRTQKWSKNEMVH